MSQRRQFDNLVFSLRSFDATVNFLQSYEVGSFFVDYIGDPLEIEFLVHSYADVDVVSHDAKRTPGPCRGRAAG
jgi:hypothetical protein